MEECKRKRCAEQENESGLSKRVCREADVQQQRHAFIATFKAMVDDLEAQELLPGCISRRILSPEEVDEVSAEKTRQTRNNRLLCTIYRKANVNAEVLVHFTGVLEDVDTGSGCLQHIIEGLRSQRPTPSGESPYVGTEDSLQAVLQTLYQVICSSVDVTHILPELISKEVITVAQNEEVRTGKTLEERAASLLNMVRYCDPARLCAFFRVLLSSNQLPQQLAVVDLLKQQPQQNPYPGRSPEADAFKKAMRKLVSLKEEDVDRLTVCLYSHNIISESLRDMILSQTSSRSQLGKTTNLLRHVETKIKQCPQLYNEIVEIFAEELNLSEMAATLERHYRECYGTSLSTSVLPRPHDVERDSVLSHATAPESSFTLNTGFPQQLKEVYNTGMLATQKWPCTMRNGFYINLAIIKKEKVTRATADVFTKETIHKGDLDAILKIKVPVEMEDIFKVNPGDRLQVILVQGGPGVGKSTFALELARKWSVFEEMRRFQLVLLVQLRQPYAHTATSINDLLRSYGDDPTIDAIAEYIIKKQGEGLLLILDGFDELPADSDSFYIKLLEGRYLSKATILLTTRPSVITRIEQVCESRVSKNIEILGFLSPDIEEFARKSFNGEEAEQFLEYVYSHPHIKSMMYIPLNTTIVVEIYRCFANQRVKRLPMTLTQLYTELCICLLKRYGEDKKLNIKPGHSQEESFISRLSCIPENVQQQLKEIASLAFQGICQQKVVFHHLHPEFEHMNFLNKCEWLVRVPFDSHRESSFNFLHFTVQEFLAAYHISLQSPDEQLQILQLYHSEPHFSQVWRFLAGLTSFEAIGWGVFAGSMRVPSCESEMKMCNSLLSNCLYEAQVPSTCSQVFPSGCVVYSPMSVTQYDYYTLGYCISNSPCRWKICSIGGDGLAMIAAGIKSNPGDPKGRIELIKLSYNGEKILDLKELPECMRESITELNLSNCDLKDTACHCLGKLLPSFPNLERLDIGDNPFTMGGAKSLLSSLSQLSKMSYLDLLHAQLSLDDIGALRALIKPGGTLKNLIVGSTTMTGIVVEEMVTVILRDSNLQNLSIMNLDLAQFGSHLGKKLEENKTLHTLMLWDRSFCIEGCVEVVRALERNSTLQSLTLMPWYQFHIPDSLFNSRIKWFYYPEQK